MEMDDVLGGVERCWRRLSMNDKAETVKGSGEQS
jgi:hypothetical protein